MFKNCEKEQHFENNTFHGYIDFISEKKDCFYEVKLRSKTNLDK
jgi:hypothetical protein